MVVPAATTLVLFAVLIGLGTWQIRRLAWKEGILAEIAQSEAAPPTPLGADVGAYRKVFVTGTLSWPDAASYGAEVRDTQRGTVMGSQAIVPLLRPDGATILVDLGWLPEGQRPAGPATPVSVTGYVRPGEQPGWFAATDDLAGKRFYTLNPRQIGATLGLHDVAPFVLVALGPPPMAGPVPAEHLPAPPNNHLSYAITWFGLAGALLVVFFTWARRARIDARLHG